MNASHFVLKEIIEALDSGGDAGPLLRKFAKRYPHDSELADAARIQGEYAETKDPQKLASLKKKLGELYQTRTLESGGGRLPLKDRRTHDDKILRDVKEPED